MNETTKEKTTVDKNEAELLEWINVVQTGTGRSRDKAMGSIMERFMPYMNKAAMRMDPTGGEDALSAATEGLYHAVMNFRPETGNKFFTYAYNCISGYVGMALRNGRLIRITNSELKHLRKKENRDEYSARSRLLSLNETLNGDDERDNEFLDTIAYIEDFSSVEDEKDPEEEKAQEKRVALIRAALDKNEKRNRENQIKADFDEITHEYDNKMFCMMHGILNEPQYTPKEIAEILQEKGVPMTETTVRSRCNTITRILIQEKMEEDRKERNRTHALANYLGEDSPDPNDAYLGTLFGGCDEHLEIGGISETTPDVEEAI